MTSPQVSTATHSIKREKGIQARQARSTHRFTSCTTFLRQVRIMAKCEFRIVAMWESRFDDRSEFVYLLPGLSAIAALTSRYMPRRSIAGRLIALRMRMHTDSVIDACPRRS
jgi:hypothetical protein